MRKKFTMLLTALLCCVGVAKAQYYVIESIGDNITDLSALTEDSYVALYNVGRNKFIYEGTDYKMYMGTEASVGAGHEYIWQVHKEGEKFLFTSLSGKYISTPLDRHDVYTVASDNNAKDQFTITAHSEDDTKWKLQSTNNTNIYWDAQDGRFVGWQGSGANSQYEIRPVTVSTLENDFTKLLTLDENNIKWLAIKNVRKQKFATYAGDEATMTQQTNLTTASLFYFTGRATDDLATVRIHSYVAGDKLCAGYNSWTDAGVEWYIKNQTNGKSIAKDSPDSWSAWNDAGGGGQIIEYWAANDAGSAWELVSDFTEYITFAKAAAVSEIENLSKISAIYPAATEAKAALDAITGTDAAAWMAVNEVLVNYKKSVNGKNVRLTTYGRNASDGHDLTAVAAGGNGTTASADAGIWTLISNADGTFKMYNFVSNLYLGATRGQSQRVLTYESSADAASYTFNATTEGNVVNLWNNGNTLHMDGSANIVQWNDNSAGASIWKVVSCEPIVITREQYDAAAEAKDALPYAIQEAYGLVTDASNYYSNYKSDAEGSYAALLDNTESSYFHSAYGSEPGDGSGVHYIQADLGEGNSIDEFYFYMKPRSGNGNNRPKNITVYGSNDINGEFTEIADVTTTLDGSMTPYLSAKLGTDGTNYRYIRLTVTSTNSGSQFFTLSELYFFPANPDITSLVGSYNTFSQVSITSNDFVTAADALLNAETKLELSNIKKEVAALLSANAYKHAVVPVLGQYTTEAYNALEEAYGAPDATQESLEAAIEAFNASLNAPVYIIKSAWDGGYSAGSAIYYDGAWRWKKANRYDRQMWMTIPGYTEAGVPAAVGAYDANGTSYGFCDYLTGTKIRGKEGVQLVKITGWPEAYSLQYAASGQDAAHHAQSGGALVNWHPALLNDRQASAWTVEYLGNTYDLKNLTDEHLTALAGVQTVFDSKIHLFSAEFGDGVGQYQGDAEAEGAIKSTLFEISAFLDQNLGVLSEKTVDEINAWTTSLNDMPVATINLPAEGYYRIYGANSNVSPAGQYITGHTNADGGRIALTNDADASTIYYYADGKLQAYQSGKYIGLNSGHFVFATSKDDETHPASAITFAASSYIAGAYTIKSADRYLHYKVHEGNVEIDRCQAEESANDSWYLEKLEKETFTYTYKVGETELATQEVKEFAGMPYPAANAVLPLGYTATALTGNVVKDETAKDIVCEFNAEAIPFEYYDSYANVEQWYYLHFAKDQNFLYYAEDNTVLDATQTAIDRTNREAYAWAFIGTPVTGFQVVNKLAGADKGLKAMKSDALTGGVVGEGAHTFKLTASEHFTDAKGFYMAATNGETSDRFNKQDGVMVYWSGADAGSTFTVAVCPFGAVAELEALIAEAEELKTTVDANTGDKIGEFSEETASALANAITTAQSKGDAATAEDVAALQAVLDATKIILPTAGQYYQIHSSYFSTDMAVYSNGSNAMWKALNGDDKSFYWKAVATEDGIALMNAADEKYIQAGWSVADEAKNIAVKILAKTDAEGAAYEKGYRYGIFMNDGQMHANGHDNGAGTSGNLVNYGGGADGASSWYIVPVELPTFCDIVYVFKHDGVAVEKYTQTASLKAGAAYPAVQVPALPYGVSTNAATPEGNVTEDKIIEFTLIVDKALPFETTTDAESEDTKWYYMQMHVFDKSYMKYIQDCDTYIEWNDLDVADDEIDSHLWCFVGDLWNGVKVVNKATKNAIVSTDGVASMGAEGTAFMPTASDNTGDATYFCLQNPDSKYLNAQKAQDEEVGKVKHWTDNDNGSTFFVTEADKEYSITIGEAGYTTYYSNYRLAIPTTVKAYIIDEVNGKSINLTEVTGVLPAQTGVILEGNMGEYKFVTSAAETDNVDGNLLKGTTAQTLITPDEGIVCYVLAKGADGEAGLYQVNLNRNESGDVVGEDEEGGSFLNGANKAYLPVSTTSATLAPAMFSFARGTTAIENSEFIYDLTGRRIEKIVEKGIYIVNGKKVVIK